MQNEECRMKDELAHWFFILHSLSGSSSQEESGGGGSSQKTPDARPPDANS
jgi:hypothetical protein